MMHVWKTSLGNWFISNASSVSIKRKLNFHHIVLLLLARMQSTQEERNQWSRFGNLLSAVRCRSTGHPPVSGNTRKKLKAPQRRVRALVAGWKRWRPQGRSRFCRVPCSGCPPGAQNSAPAPTARYSSNTLYRGDLLNNTAFTLV